MKSFFFASLFNRLICLRKEWRKSVWHVSKRDRTGFILLEARNYFLDRMLESRVNVRSRVHGRELTNWSVAFILDRKHHKVNYFKLLFRVSIFYVPYNDLSRAEKFIDSSVCYSRDDDFIYIYISSCLKNIFVGWIKNTSNLYKRWKLINLNGMYVFLYFYNIWYKIVLSSLLEWLLVMF